MLVGIRMWSCWCRRYVCVCVGTLILLCSMDQSQTQSLCLCLALFAEVSVSAIRRWKSLLCIYIFLPFSSVLQNPMHRYTPHSKVYGYAFKFLNNIYAYFSNNYVPCQFFGFGETKMFGFGETKMSLMGLFWY